MNMNSFLTRIDHKVNNHNITNNDQNRQIHNDMVPEEGSWIEFFGKAHD